MGTALFGDEVRAEAARTLFRGLGYLFSRKHAASQPAFQEAVAVLTGIDGSSDEQFDLVTEALNALPHGQHKTITENALGGYSPYQGQQLADRRRSIAEHFNVSERTVFRKEDRGVVELIEHIDRILDRPNDEAFEGEALHTRLVIDATQALMKRISRIQRTATGADELRKMRDAIKSFLDEMAPYDNDETTAKAARSLIARYRDWHEDLSEMLRGR